MLIWSTSHISYTISYSHLTAVYASLGNLAISIGVALVMVLAFEATILHIEKVTFGLLGLGKMPSVVRKPPPLEPKLRELNG